MSVAHRIHVIGAAGTGKTTLGRALAVALRVPHFDMDDYYHVPTEPPFQQQRTPEEFCVLLDRDVAPLESWVVTGGVLTWQPPPARSFTTIVFLRLPQEIRLDRIRRREQARYGDRISPGGDMEESHRSFMEWAKGYDDNSAKGTNTLLLHEDRLREATCPVVRLADPMDPSEAVRRVLDHVGAGRD
jgi:adenylate kinase family enzyme